ncbi:hypothetical protein D6C76_07298 [Aureobasidium pullulans]|nr:hypothetical protein D6C76_07298 [Aureobasidium pullulans]
MYCRDVCKRHMERCKRGLKSRKRRSQGSRQTAQLVGRMVNSIPTTEAGAHQHDELSYYDTNINQLGGVDQLTRLEQQDDNEVQETRVAQDVEDFEVQHVISRNNAVTQIAQGTEAYEYETAFVSDTQISPTDPSGRPEHEPPQSSLNQDAHYQFEDDMFGILTDPCFLKNLPTYAVEADPTAHGITDNISPTSAPRNNADVLARFGVSRHTSMAFATAYFTHLYPFLPVVHRYTFSLANDQPLLVSIVVALGSVYSTSDTDPHSRCRLGYSLWAAGVKELRTHVNNKPSMLCERWVLQAWILHVIFGFYHGDTKSSDVSISMLQKLVNKNLRSRCVLNQDMTLRRDKLWTAQLHQTANWKEQDLTRAWSKFISQETFRICVYALSLIDLQISFVCNSRPFLWSTESTWWLPAANKIWEASSAEDWLDLVQGCLQDGTLTTETSDIASKMSMTQITQAILNGKPSAKLVQQISACPFAIMCIVTSVESLARDFSASYYQMPPVLPDPSAYHVLPPTQNRCINAAISLILSLCDKEDLCQPQMRRSIQLNSWAIRISLCEPDVMMVAGVVDTTLAAGLATSTHLILGSGVATRRAAVTTRRASSEGVSLTMWDDLLKSVPVILESAEHNSIQGPPWMTAQAYRLLLLLWRTLRVAIQDLEKTGDKTPLSAFNPAKIMIQLIRESLDSLVSPERDSDTGPDEVEASLMLLMSRAFGTTSIPINCMIRDILSKTEGLLMSSQRSRNHTGEPELHST